MTTIVEVQSDLDNRLALLVEHSELNKNNYKLNYVLLLDKEGNKFFISTHSEIILLNKYIGQLICPYCMQELTFVASYVKGDKVIDAHLRHKGANHLNKNCIFNSTGNKTYRLDSDRFYASKGYIEYKLKMKLKQAIVDNKLVVDIPNGYKIDQDTLEIIYSYERHKIDKIFTTKNDNYLCKLVAENGLGLICIRGENALNLRGRMCETWRKSNSIVIALYDKYLESDDNRIESKITKNTEEIYLQSIFNSVQDKAFTNFFIAEKVKNKEDKVKLVEEKIDTEEFYMGLTLKNDKGITRVVYTDKHNDWITKHGEVCELIWINITLDGVVVNRKYPQVVIKELKRLKYKVNYGYYAI